MKTVFSPLSHENWADFEQLFGPKGACGGCWCMAWRLKSAEFRKQLGEQNKKAIKKLAKNNIKPGIMVYVDKVPAGWCAIAPRSSYIRLETSRILKPVDDQPVWSLSCFFIKKPFRNQGLSVKLIKEAVLYARKHGAKIVEAYPYEPAGAKMPDVFAWTGIASAFVKAGFEEVMRRSAGRPIMRYYL